MRNQGERPRVVFDCMVYLQATANADGPAAAVFRLLDSDAINLFISPAILEEVVEVLSRPKVRLKNPAITDVRLAALIKRLADKATLITDIPRQFEFGRDPKDEPYINLAIKVEAEYIVSRDRDLLDLMTSDDPSSSEFRKRFKFLKVITPNELLLQIESGEQS